MQPGQLQLPSLSNGMVVVTSPAAGIVVGVSRGVDTVMMTSIMSVMKMVERCIKLCVALVVARGMISTTSHSLFIYVLASRSVREGRVTSINLDHVIVVFLHNLRERNTDLFRRLLDPR